MHYKSSARFFQKRKNPKNRCDAKKHITSKNRCDEKTVTVFPQRLRKYKTHGHRRSALREASARSLDWRGKESRQATRSAQRTCASGLMSAKTADYRPPLAASKIKTVHQ
jgi:hypothetical protein